MSEKDVRVDMIVCSLADENDVFACEDKVLNVSRATFSTLNQKSKELVVKTLKYWRSLLSLPEQIEHLEDGAFWENRDIQAAECIAVAAAPCFDQTSQFNIGHHDPQVAGAAQVPVPAGI
ncbi:hypothetical protein DFQ28_007197 [Apophysomyces sp. BC1034]|nr:hypothetical protein DFQ30_007108 [Apophysomyces sp. BC1015]KAG0178577.1 hypothetical protein DFQ29_003295 [Apophysomyces sp. BC1021]KAG0186856.1 hypothetical protein DFQ28_007197 [Apophysomyces sp. BC1034]